MKKRILPLAAILLALLLLTAAGTAADPLITKSYLTGGFTQALAEVIDRRIDASDASIRSCTAPGPQEQTLKEGDVLQINAGQTILLLSGEARPDISAGALIDVTSGIEHPSNQLLQPNHRYIAGENAAAAITVASPAAVLSCEGGAVLVPSQTPDYYAIACALRDVDLFRGTGSGIGEGFELSRAPNRGEGLVMFLRVLGEEAQALACTTPHPFTDVPAWLSPYVSWAYAQGYTSGISKTRFAPSRALTAAEYEEFLLRALHYSDPAEDNYATSLSRALAQGILTSGEHAMLKERPFLRAYAAYVSYYALEVPLQDDTQTLAQSLVAAERMTAVQLTAARNQVATARIS